MVRVWVAGKTVCSSMQLTRPYLNALQMRFLTIRRYKNRPYLILPRW